MFSTKYFVKDINDIPSNWIFENYLGTGKLVGQSVNIKSIFNEDDKTPSMFIYCKDGIYKFKCFSTGEHGSPINILMYKWKKTFSEVSKKLIEDYQNFLKSDYKISEIVEQPKWKVIDYTTRTWIKEDVKYWTKYNIDSSVLKHFNVVSLLNYTMSNGTNSFTVENKLIYGFFTNDNKLYKIYQPNDKSLKFVNILDYIQGEEQLTNKYDILIIASSLKDCMTLYSMGLQCDLIAPNSENSILNENIIEKYKEKYNKIITIFDNDKAGINSMKLYKLKYNIPFCYYSLDKDISDSVKNYGIKQTISELVPKIHRVLYD